MRDVIYPIGSIYLSVDPTNPSVWFGGTWEAWGQGRVPVGVDFNDFDFNTPERMDGSKELQEHKHGLSGTITSTFTGNRDKTNPEGAHLHSERLYVTGYGRSDTIENYKYENTTISGSQNGYTIKSTSIEQIINAGDLLNVTTSEVGSHQHTFTPSGVVVSDYTDPNGQKLTDNEGTGNSGNLQPYITCFMWKRTA